ncbi:MAG TPA: ABATE domain-containing protein [Candidatus Krumholzibacteria bacterium]|nr:ABATE domain-containing protein [Candidatus Krumholzibacteria bacterium]HPD72217.1 ABATE domain-containing protein [Candidatus Krumholzibacteria bacterium]HRY40851.1 ABATE domain-containing protein [Candidatus Krumholzibacteria bacterium]
MSVTDPNPPQEPFDLSSGSLCLDFANTWSDRGRPETDRLASYDQLVAFAVQSEAVGRQAGEGLRDLAAGDPAGAYRALARARGLRDVLYRLFSNLAAGRPIAAADLARLNEALGPALARLRIAPEDGAFAWHWNDAAPGDLDRPLAPIVRSAAELLTGERRARVRECDADGCTWLFIDTSRNRSRRWCSMASCGNRAKARRHYQRRRGP